MTDKFPVAITRGAGNCLVGSNGTTIDGKGGWDVKFVEYLEQAPESDPVPILVPSPVGDVGHGRTASGRSKDGARHGLANVPFFHVDDHPHGEALALRQCEARAL